MSGFVVEFGRGAKYERVLSELESVSEKGLGLGRD